LFDFVKNFINEAGFKKYSVKQTQGFSPIRFIDDFLKLL